MITGQLYIIIEFALLYRPKSLILLQHHSNVSFMYETWCKSSINYKFLRSEKLQSIVMIKIDCISGHGASKYHKNRVFPVPSSLKRCYALFVHNYSFNR